MLDFDSEDIDGMDDDAGDEQEPLPTGHWKPTSSYDVYMVDTPIENDDKEGRTQRRVVPSRSSQSNGVSAAPNPSSAETAIIWTQR